MTLPKALYVCDTVCSHCGSSPLKTLPTKFKKILMCIRCKAVKCAGLSEEEYHAHYHDLGDDPNSTTNGKQMHFRGTA